MKIVSVNLAAQITRKRDTFVVNFIFPITNMTPTHVCLGASFQVLNTADTWWQAEIFNLVSSYYIFVKMKRIIPMVTVTCNCHYQLIYILCSLKTLGTSSLLTRSSLTPKFLNCIVYINFSEFTFPNLHFKIHISKFTFSNSLYKIPFSKFTISKQ